LNSLYEPIQILVFLIYFINLSVFLILGSPRRLVANSIVVWIVYREFSLGARNINYLYALIASLFHTSSIVIIPIVYFLRKKVSEWLSVSNLFKLIIACFFGGGLLQFIGVIDLIFLKIEYYLVYSIKEQEYLKEVPSVYSGLAKRSVSLFLMWLVIRRWDKASYVLALGLIELVSYTVLGYFSPVLAVVATYFSICYILPFTMIEYRRSRYSSKIILLMSVMVYFLPTIVGLIKIFGSIYV
ncbi:EpsG family protein, partial [Vibrio vulnificus]|uniref:EpsG family protein n=1 Tax=Vibrio vulnificus TaxID=672 RepID=UPI0013EECF5D